MANINKIKGVIGILTGGGDCPGLNSAIKWVTKTALDPLLAAKRKEKFEVWGIRDGWRGLVEVDPKDTNSVQRWLMPLDELLVRTWDRSGGTLLGTSRTNPFSRQNDCSGDVLKNIKALFNQDFVDMVMWNMQIMIPPYQLLKCGSRYSVLLVRLLYNLNLFLKKRSPGPAIIFANLRDFTRPLIFIPNLVDPADRNPCNLPCLISCISIVFPP